MHTVRSRPCALATSALTRRLPWDVRYRIRRTQYGYNREFVVFDDWCQREDHIDSSMVVGSNEEVSQAILKGDMLVNEAHLRRIDECVASSSYLRSYARARVDERDAPRA